MSDQLLTKANLVLVRPPALKGSYWGKQGILCALSVLILGGYAQTGCEKKKQTGSRLLKETRYL
jgi:hypothetical protein